MTVRKPLSDSLNRPYGRSVKNTIRLERVQYIPFYFSRNESVGHIAGTRTTITCDGRTQEAKGSHLGKDGVIKLFDRMSEQLKDHRKKSNTFSPPSFQDARQKSLLFSGIRWYIERKSALLPDSTRVLYLYA